MTRFPRQPDRRWRVGRVLVTAAVALCSAVGLTAVSSRTAQAQVGQEVTLRYVSSTPSVRHGDTLDISVAIDGTIPADAVMVLWSHQSILNRSEFANAAKGELPERVDIVRIDAGKLALVDGVLALSVPVEFEDRSSDGLRVAGLGLQAVELSIETIEQQLVSNRLVAFTEFVDDSIDERLPVGFVVEVNGEQPLRPNDTMLVSDGDRFAFSALTDLLLDAPVPITTHIEPDAIGALALSDAPGDTALVTRLNDAIDGDELMSVPTIHIDPDDAVAANQGPLFTDALREGQDILADALPNATLDSTLWLTGTGVTQPATRLLRDVGFRSVLLDRGALGEIDERGRTAALGTLPLESDRRFIGLAADASLQSAVGGGPGSDPAYRVHLLMSDLAAIRWERQTDHLFGVDIARGVVIMLGRPETMDRDLLIQFWSVLLKRPDLIEPATASDVVRIMERGSDEALLSELRSARPTPDNLIPTALLTAELSALANSLYGMLGIDESGMLSGQELLEDVHAQLRVMHDPTLAESQRSAFEDTITGSLTALRSLVQRPTQSNITLGGRSSKLPLTLTADTPQEVTVMVKLSSAKLEFPSGNEIIVKLQGTRTIDIPVVVKGNGKFPATVELWTPDGKLQLTRTTTFSVRASAITGLSQLLSGVLVLLLLSWWFQHARRARRKRRSDDTRTRHPNAGQDAQPDTQPDTLSGPSVTHEPDNAGRGVIDAVSDAPSFGARSPGGVLTIMPSSEPVAAALPPPSSAAIPFMIDQSSVITAPLKQID